MEKLNAIITGCSGHLGKIITEYFIQKNINVIGIDLNAKNSFKSENNDSSADYYKLDLSEKNDIKKILSEITDKYAKIDILINNASVRTFKEFSEFSDKEIYDSYQVNILSPIVIIKALMPIMLKNNFGRVINISSISGMYGYRTGSLYCSTKSALIEFTKSLSYDLEYENKNVTANVICPDSFYSRENEKSQNHDYIIKHILKFIDKSITTKINGKIKIIVSPTDKLFFI